MAAGGLRPTRAARRDVPLYEMVDSLVRKRLVDRVYPPGAMLPSEIQLAREFGVSQGTVRRALDALATEGLLHRRQGLGTFVPELEDRRSLFLFFNMVGLDGRQEMPAAEVLEARLVPVGPDDADALDITPGAPVRRLHRLRFFEERPVVYETVTASEHLLPGLGAGSDPLPDHLFRHYEAAYGVTVVDAREEIRAVAASDAVAAHLGVTPGAPLLAVDRIAYTIDRRPVERRVSLCDTSNHLYRVDRG